MGNRGARRAAARRRYPLEDFLDPHRLQPLARDHAIVGRRTDPETGNIYHLEHAPPPAEIAARLVQRKDDTEEACRTRLATYHAQTAPIVPHYERQGLVRRVDGTGEPDEVTARIRAVLR